MKAAQPDICMNKATKVAEKDCLVWSKKAVMRAKHDEIDNSSMAGMAPYY